MLVSATLYCQSAPRTASSVHRYTILPTPDTVPAARPSANRITKTGTRPLHPERSFHMANSNLPPITNVVVLMLENRSFDNVVGTLYPRSASFEGLPLNESNQDAQGQSYTVANNPNSAAVPPIDPGECFMDMNLQIFGNTDGTGTESMSGFVLDYLAGAGEFPAIPTTPGYWYTPLPRTVADSKPPICANGQDIMNYFNAAQMPVTWQLAQTFGVSDAWFGSCPTQTFPNRLFLQCGTAGGYVDDYEYYEYILNNVAIPNLPSVYELLDGGKG